MLTQAELKAVINYDPETGVFKWKKLGKGRRCSLVAGTVTNKGYIHICIQRKRYLSHVLAWLYTTGEYPTFELDHENRNTIDNRIKNIRRATHSQNLINSKIRTDNASGCPGVCWDRQKLKWKVQITVNNKRIAKHFVTFERAVEFYKQTAEQAYGQFVSAERQAV